MPCHSLKGEIVMLARGKGFITFEHLKALFGLPEDSEVARIEMHDDGVEVYFFSAEPIDKKTVESDSFRSIRRFRPTPSEAVANNIAEEIIKGLQKKGTNNDA